MITRFSHCLTTVIATGISTGLLAATGLFAGCAPTEPTQIVSGMRTQMRVPEEIESVGLVVQSGGKQVFCENYQVDFENQTVTLPSTFAANSQGDITTPLTVTVLGFHKNDSEFENNCYVERQVGTDAKAPIVMRKRRSTFVLNEALYMPMPLHHSCAGVACDSKTETCIAGKCEKKIDVTPDSLTGFNEAAVFGRNVDCFNVKRCANPNPPTAVPVIVKDREKCEFEAKIPKELMKTLPANAGLNVSLVHDNLTWEVLDLNEEEGFYFTKESDGLTTFRLAPGTCETRYHNGKIPDVVASVGCPSKTPGQAFCEKDHNSLMLGESGPASVKGMKPLASNLHLLRPIKGGIFVLIDRQDFYATLCKNAGEMQSLNKALNSPALSNIHISFGIPLSLQEKTSGTVEWIAAYDPENPNDNGFVNAFSTHCSNFRSIPNGERWFPMGDVKKTILENYPNNSTFVLITKNQNAKDILANKDDQDKRSLVQEMANESDRVRGDDSELEMDLIVDDTDDDNPSRDNPVNDFNEKAKAPNSPVHAHELDEENADDISRMQRIAETLSSVISRVATCKYQIPENWNSSYSVISYQSDEGNQKPRMQIHKCQSDSQTDCWNQKAGKSPYIEVKGKSCTNLRKTMGKSVGKAVLLGGLMDDLPIYISAQ